MEIIKTNMMKLGEKGFKLIKRYEGLHDGDLSTIGLQPKMCPVGIWTIGWGHAIIYQGKFLRGDENHDLALSLYPALTIAEADKFLEIDIAVFENNVSSLNLNFNQDQFDALVSFCYNEGFGALLGSTLLKRIKSHIGDITAAFAMWNKGKIKGVYVVLPGLTFRRKTEALLYMTSELKFFN